MKKKDYLKVHKITGSDGLKAVLDSAIQNCSILQKVEMFQYVQKVTEDRG